MLLLSATLPPGSRAAAGDLDTSFDTDGKATTDFFGADDLAYAVAIEADGRVVVAGQARNPVNGNIDFALARYNADGALDSSFGQSGRITTDFLGGIDDARASAIQPDSKVVVAGFK